LRFLLTPARTREVLVQWSKQDRIVVLPFSDRVLWTATASGMTMIKPRFSPRPSNCARATALTSTPAGQRRLPR